MTQTQEQEHQQELYRIKEVAQITGMTEHLIRKYLKLFNIQAEQTSGGHRRLTQENINMLLEAKRLKEENNYSLKQIGEHFNGGLTDEMIEKNPSLKTLLEESVEDLQERLEMNTQQMNSMKEVMQEILKKNHQDTILLEELKKALPDPKGIEEKQHQQNKTVQEIRIESRKEAIAKWNTKPEEERFTRGGFLGLQKIENVSKRTDFIEEYIDNKVLEYLNNKS